jgi:hypothetical protein
MDVLGMPADGLGEVLDRVGMLRPEDSKESEPLTGEEVPRGLHADDGHPVVAWHALAGRQGLESPA